jgi:hypothetical protein
VFSGLLNELGIKVLKNCSGGNYGKLRRPQDKHVYKTFQIKSRRLKHYNAT